MRKTIMVVDDARVVRMLEAHTLMNAGFDVIEAENGLDALEKINGRSFDLIVTDINMPGLDGIGLIRELRKLEACRFTPIIVLSTVAQEARIREGREAGASGWLYKPFTGAQLMQAVRKFIA
jgi:two-component system, chemotaxis family, chemotaxis protein CheY